ncbi:hypothetical protein MKQ70_13740 [Chitinophaga sedimenti]|uniref:hypothetical protein n=1 Tax=Chitinophaga sedimenti TaxID=2033606 RepID=UPI002003B595|nr:hypothetical protein [Chitinophaga sedimenti]MCK7556025.1 hypothetical protein [Chitinophaga sedimenti]
MMTRQITVNLHGNLVMADLQVEKAANGVVYYIVANKNFSGQIPDQFPIVVNEAHEPEYDKQALSEEGLYIVLQIWNEIRALPAQFKGGEIS